ncbi:MAG: FHA domain-containing protein [Myxococcales bacterium]|nr:FHA domain-containing protein [Myxococcales bacterium]
MTTFNDLFAPAPRRLRVLDGPLQGTTHALGDRFLIGRSAGADLQLFDDRVSREHAEIVCGPNNRHWLVDLDSVNGTYTAGWRVERIELDLDTIFQIASTRFVYEEEVATIDDQAGQTFVVAEHHAPSRRGTIEYDRPPLPRPPRVGPPTKAQPLESRDMYRGTATDSRGVTYPGNIAEDIALYHLLEHRASYNELHSTAELDRLEWLRRHLGPRIEPDQGPVEPSFSCSFPAVLRLPSGQRVSVMVTQIQASGAWVQTKCEELSFRDQAWLTVDLVNGTRTRTVVFACAVTSVKDGHLGLSFAFHEERSCRQTHQAYRRLPPTKPERKLPPQAYEHADHDRAAS